MEIRAAEENTVVSDKEEEKEARAIETRKENKTSANRGEEDKIKSRKIQGEIHGIRRNIQDAFFKDFMKETTNYPTKKTRKNPKEEKRASAQNQGKENKEKLPQEIKKNRSLHPQSKKAASLGADTAGCYLTARAVNTAPGWMMDTAIPRSGKERGMCQASTSANTNNTAKSTIPPPSQE